MSESKPIWQSKTFIFNAVALLALVAQWAIGHHWLSATDSAFLLGAGNILLRLVTNQPVTVLPQGK